MKVELPDIQYEKECPSCFGLGYKIPNEMLPNVSRNCRKCKHRGTIITEEGIKILQFLKRYQVDYLT